MNSAPSSKPILYDRSTAAGEEEFQTLLRSGDVRHCVDEYRSQLRELFAINNADKIFTSTFKEEVEAYIESAGYTDTQGKWAYFPWSSTVVHILDDGPFQKVRTARNRNLISDSEQKKFYDSVVGIAGLSVGNSVALAIVLTGGSRKIKLADHDVLDLSNLNRIRGGVDALGLSKVEMTARQIYALNPYAEVEIYREGLTGESIPKFFSGLDVVIDEIDNLAMKLRIREEAKRLRLPVLMAADNDRMGVIDFERYDLNPHLEFFDGKLGGATFESLSSLDKREVGKTIATLVGLENHTPRMLTSLTEMGKTVVSWPQLGLTALINGSFLAYAAFRVVNGYPLVSGRVVVAMDSLLDADYHEPAVIDERNKAIKAFRSIFNL